MSHLDEYFSNGFCIIRNAISIKIIGQLLKQLDKLNLKNVKLP